MSQTPRIRGGIGADGPYWDALERGVFQLPRCAGCGAWMWPAHYRCGDCGSWDMAWVPLDPIGTLYTWTRMHQAPVLVRERTEDVPYVTLLAEIPAAGGKRVVGALHGSEDGLAIGTPIRGVFLPPSPKTKGYATLGWEIMR